MLKPRTTRIATRFVAVFLAAGLGACAAPLRAPMVAGGNWVRLPGVSVPLPVLADGRAWANVARSRTRNMFFAKHAATNETLIMQLRVGKTQTGQTPEEFLSIFKEARANKMNRDQFDMLVNEAELSTERTETCIKYKTVSNDHGASAVRAGGFTQLHNMGLYCIHPMRADLAVSVEYSRKAPPAHQSERFYTDGAALLKSLQFEAVK